ncbi:hypothetical protein OS493_025115 [Desmophyllum pertusum]|uniref:Uncharacterized protein n=1 Tax=Desmophyllum pertusum TaxID=174260 RepID=A0A9X0CDD7_9CNID|nr:hypothetical protein OS493_025115 [Desmophyllum pertusum]
MKDLVQAQMELSIGQDSFLVEIKTRSCLKQKQLEKFKPRGKTSENGSYANPITSNYRQPLDTMPHADECTETNLVYLMSYVPEKQIAKLFPNN